MRNELQERARAQAAQPRAVEQETELTAEEFAMRRKTPCSTPFEPEDSSSSSSDLSETEDASSSPSSSSSSSDDYAPDAATLRGLTGPLLATASVLFSRHRLMSMKIFPWPADVVSSRHYRLNQHLRRSFQSQNYLMKAPSHAINLRKCPLLHRNQLTSNSLKHCLCQ